MKVLFCIRSDAQRFPGGDYIHLLKTQEALQRLGLRCETSIGQEPIASDIDIVHLFNTTRIHETYLRFREAKRRGLPVVLTPIWHSLREMQRFYIQLYRAPFFPISFYLAAKEYFYAQRSHLTPSGTSIFRFKATQRKVIEQCEAILPNSQPELKILEEELAATPKASFIVPPGVDPPPAPLKFNQDRKDLLCVGRLEPRKNQLNIIRAFKALGRNGHRLLLYGNTNSAHPHYVRQVEKTLESGWVEFRGQVSREQIYQAYAQAKGVVLASFFETCGFSAMEGLSCGAHACVSDTPYTRAFYGDSAAYCDPYSPDSISSGLKSILSRPDASYTSLLKDFSWEKTARKTLAVYNTVVH